MQTLLLLTHIVVALVAILFSIAVIIAPHLAKRRIMLATNTVTILTGVVLVLYTGGGLAKICFVGFLLGAMTLLAELRLYRAKQAGAL